jgi:hypothetical protein
MVKDFTIKLCRNGVIVERQVILNLDGRLNDKRLRYLAENEALIEMNKTVSYDDIFNGNVWKVCDATIMPWGPK